MFEEKIKKDTQIRESMKKLDQLARFRVVTCLADLQPVMKRMNEKDVEVIKEEMYKLTPEEQDIVLQIWLCDFMDRNRLGEIVKMD